jgi:hypothetical protein
LRFCQDMRPNEWRKRLRRDELYRTPEALFEEVGKRKKPVERLGAGGKLYQEVDIAVGPGTPRRTEPNKASRATPSARISRSEDARIAVACFRVSGLLIA